MAITRPPFIPFDERRVSRVYQRHLPHWRQDGATYFVTFRLGDSIPDAVRREIEYEQSLWLRARGIRYDGPAGHWRAALEKLPHATQFGFRGISTARFRLVSIADLANVICEARVYRGRPRQVA